MLGQLTAPKNLCLLRLSAIGDVCHAVAMVQQIQHYYPKTKITWVIGKVEANLLQGLPNVEFVIFDKKAGFKGYQNLRAELAHQKFDVLLHMQVALRASLASWCIKAKVKIGFDSKRAKEGQWLFTNHQIAPQHQPHVLDGFMGFAKAIGVPTESPRWEMPIGDENERWASELLSVESNKPIAVISPAASKAERNWHAEGYAQTADYLTQLGFHVVICGGPTTLEQLLATEIISFSKCDIVNLVGKTNLKQLLAVLKLSHLVIAPDTGPAHMAVTVDTPVIGLYAHSNPNRTGPYLYQNYVVSCYQHTVQEQYKQKLEHLPWGIRAKGSDLMNSITFTQVKEKLLLLINDYYPEFIIK
ncbi:MULTISPECIES: glycosyltransferase family 9 protein [unclassified Colwellia]|uniref:glycosyltransferase family 9 protein n=1 Tax=unclassified Colwellia TaxID=196834 RepID=UPI0015F4E990|nr:MULTISPECIES: glycosyltransferase family 9 protein [unclassified Colwellia]MBA6231186.1 glycosyltransferase family 9 protein [Colwellia sp. MB02u-7]MBA6235045.1 glycosyltransferase family 9 protein [Colwellia sp. MB02u-11]MBA6257571.1 glycosyltransferase family 9 protein [Colwellia sp. MB3u-28]MBA6260643.1 glycosyltransferase family 9 protein [Colwellia sp. MB3u-41]MBA6301746.1 glycosyltransferase family 9 protein [Colwellia sp. MB3u-22]